MNIEPEKRPDHDVSHFLSTCLTFLTVILASLFPSPELTAQQMLAKGEYGDMLYPYVHEYDQILCYKIGMDYCPTSNLPSMNASEILELIQRIDHLTRGIPKIVYLVGWQYLGHDTGYPSFLKINPALKRPGDSTALASLRWLMRAAPEFHTLVSVHLNFSDCYLDDNPLGPIYRERDILVRETDGRHRQGYRWCDHMAYRASNYRNWYQGTFRTEQIDPLFKMIPELVMSGSLHPDAWYNTDNPYYQVDAYEDCKAMREMTVYVRGKYNVDLTTEFDLGRPEGVDFTLYHPMIWHPGWNRKTPVNPMKTPSYFMTGGDAFFWGSEELSVIGKFFGHSATLEAEINRDHADIPGGLKSFATRTLPWYFLNRHLRSTFNGDTAFYSDGVITMYQGKMVIKSGDDILMYGEDVFIPALWKPGREIIAYSGKGYRDHMWRLPEDWSGVNRVDLYEIRLEGLKPMQSGLKVSGDRWIKLTLAADQGITIVPAGTTPDEHVQSIPSGSVQFIGSDLHTKGNWKGNYGAKGFIIIGDEQNLEQGTKIRFINGEDHIWEKEARNIQALQRASNDSRIAAGRSHGLHEIVELEFEDGREHMVSLYFLDWDRSGRWAVVDVIDTKSRKLLHSFNLTGFKQGEYLKYRVRGKIAFRITNVWTQRYQDSPDAVFSGIFIDE